jgi:hypothetical protein
MLNRRRFLGGLLATGVAGCATAPGSTTTDPNSTFNLLSKTYASKVPPPGRYPLSSEQILDIPYATLGVRIDDNPRIVMVLSTVDGQSLRWVSADFVTFVTRDGWLLKTHGLRRDLLATQWLPSLERDPLLSFAQTGTLPTRGVYRQINLGHADERGIAVESRFESRGDETIAILGTEHQTHRIDEIANMRAWRWEVRNSFWIDTQTGKVRRSVQHYCPEMPPIELEVLKPATVQI